MSHPEFKHIGSRTIRRIEELAELQQAVCKAERFGWFNHHPDRPTTTNMDDVKRETDDVIECIESLSVEMRLRQAHYAAQQEQQP